MLKYFLSDPPKPTTAFSFIRVLSVQLSWKIVIDLLCDV